MDELDGPDVESSGVGWEATRRANDRDQLTSQHYFLLVAAGQRGHVDFDRMSADVELVDAMGSALLPDL